MPWRLRASSARSAASPSSPRRPWPDRRAAVSDGRALAGRARLLALVGARLALVIARWGAGGVSSARHRAGPRRLSRARLAGSVVADQVFAFAVLSIASVGIGRWLIKRYRSTPTSRGSIAAASIRGRVFTLEQPIVTARQDPRRRQHLKIEGTDCTAGTNVRVWASTSGAQGPASELSGPRRCGYTPCATASRVQPAALVQRRPEAAVPLTRSPRAGRGRGRGARGARHRDHLHLALPRARETAAILSERIRAP